MCIFFNQVAVIGEKFQQLLAVSQFKIGEIKSRGDGAAHQCVRFGVIYGCRKPVAGLDDCLEGLPGVRVPAERDGSLGIVWIENVEGQWRTGIEMPDFILPDPMERRELVLVQQVINTG